MIRTFLLSLSGIILLFGIIDASLNRASSNASGAPFGNTGSPADNKTCARVGCHTGTATAISGVIASDVPVDGYVPGETYVISATVSDPTLIKFGFEISPQSVTGALLGTLSITDAARTKFTGSGNKYITHTLTGTSAPSHTNSWSFNWTAPAAGTGEVTFYGAFNFSNSNGTTTGDVIHTSTLTIPESVSTATENIADNRDLRVYPNPVTDHIFIEYSVTGKEQVTISLFDMMGKRISLLSNENLSSGNYKKSFSIDNQVPPGIYILELKAGNESHYEKIIRN